MGNSDWSTSWRELLLEEMLQHGENISKVVSSTMSDQELDDLFVQRENFIIKPFTVWTLKRVYFPAQYDGRVWVASVSRDPDGIPTEPVGY